MCRRIENHTVRKRSQMTNPIMSHPATPMGLQRNARTTTNTLRRDVGNVAMFVRSQVSVQPDVNSPFLSVAKEKTDASSK